MNPHAEPVDVRASNTDAPIRTRLGFIVLGLAALCILHGCTTSRVVDPPDQAVVCPPRFQQLASALAIYRAQYGVWPGSLDDLIERDLLRGVPAEKLQRYGYVSEPLAILGDGRLVMLVDDVLNHDNSVWCIVQTPAVAPRQPVVDVITLPWDTLNALAEER